MKIITVLTPSPEDPDMWRRSMSLSVVGRAVVPFFLHVLPKIGVCVAPETRYQDHRQDLEGMALRPGCCTRELLDQSSFSDENHWKIELWQRWTA